MRATVIGERGVGIDRRAYLAGAPVVLRSATARATVSGHVFVDLNGNGKANKKDAAAVGWTVFADADGNGQLDVGEVSALTDETGAYTLHVAAGTYTIRVVTKDGYQSSRRLPTSYSVSVDADDRVEGGIFGQRPISSHRSFFSPLAL